MTGRSLSRGLGTICPGGLLFAASLAWAAPLWDIAVDANRITAGISGVGWTATCPPLRRPLPYSSASSLAFAESGMDEVQRFCMNPYESICTAPGFRRSDQDAKISRFRALSSTARRDALAVYHRRVREEFPNIRERLSRVMRATLSRSDAFEGALASKIDNLLLATEDDRQGLPDAKWEFYCGSDGLRDGAGAVTVQDSRGGTPRHWVVVCPGALVTGEPDSLYEHLLHALTHECGHHVGSRLPNNSGRYNYTDAERNVLRPLYEDYIACLQTVRPFSEDTAPNGLKSSRDYNMIEITPDFWAVRSLVDYLKEKNSSGTLSGERKLEIIRRTYSGVCGTIDDDHGHPTDVFRLNYILGYDAGLREELGCQRPSADMLPTCSLRGESATF